MVGTEKKLSKEGKVAVVLSIEAAGLVAGLVASCFLSEADGE